MAGRFFALALLAACLEPCHGGGVLSKIASGHGKKGAGHGPAQETVSQVRHDGVANRGCRLLPASFSTHHLQQGSAARLLLSRAPLLMHGHNPEQQRCSLQPSRMM